MLDPILEFLNAGTKLPSGMIAMRTRVLKV